MNKIKPRNMLYQVGTIRSLLSGVYEGDLSFEELAHYGDFGLGTFDRVNGEMIALDGEFYRVDASGEAHTVAPQMKTPFAMVTHFQKSTNYEIDSFENLSSLQEYISTTFESQNIIYAIRIDAEFSQLDLRSEHPQPEGHKPLSETISKVQTTSTLYNTQGTMVGFWFPAYMKTINVAGFHFHFLDEKRSLGGHLFNLKLTKGTLKVMPIFDFGIHLIHTPLFEDMDLSGVDDEAMKKVEKE